MHHLMIDKCCPNAYKLLHVYGQYRRLKNGCKCGTEKPLYE